MAPDVRPPHRRYAISSPNTLPLSDSILRRAGRRSRPTRPSLVCSPMSCRSHPAPMPKPCASTRCVWPSVPKQNWRRNGPASLAAAFRLCRSPIYQAGQFHSGSTLNQEAHLDLLGRSEGPVCRGFLQEGAMSAPHALEAERAFAGGTWRLASGRRRERRAVGHDRLLPSVNLQCREPALGIGVSECSRSRIPLPSDFRVRL
jgi:hypothetical protein